MQYADLAPCLPLSTFVERRTKGEEVKRVTLR